MRALFLVLLYLCIATNLSAQCSISNVNLTTTSCDGNGDFQWIVDFSVVNPVSDSFSIGHSWSPDRTYAYADLPVTLDPSPGYCNQHVDLWIYDKLDMACGTIEIPLLPCCIDNGLDNFVVDTTCNSDGTFGLTFDFDFAGAPSATFDYYLARNGYDVIPTNQLNISYTSLPITFSWPGMVADCASDYDLIIFDSNDPSYTASALDMMLCCNQPPCSLSDFTVFADTTTCANGTAIFDFDFIGTSFGQNGYTVTSSSGVIRNYNLGDPQVFEELADCSTDYTFTITDADDPSCTLSDHGGLLCCPCSISSLGQMISCTGAGVNISLDLNVEGSCTYHGDPVVFVNGQQHIMTLVNGLYRLDTLANDTTQFAIEVCEDITQTNCTTIIVPNGCFTAPCTLSNFTASLDSTSCSGEIVAYDFDYVGAGFGVLGYQIYSSSGASQIYTINDPKIFYDLATCDSNTVLTIVDLQDSICTMSMLVEPACCPCMLSNLSAAVSACISGVVNLEIDLAASGSCGFYDLDFNVNGQAYTTVDSSGKFHLLGISSTDSLLTISVCDPQDASNCVSLTVLNPCYVPTCSINSVTSTWANCQTNGSVDLTIDIDATNAGTAFVVEVGGLTFPIMSTTLTIPNYTFAMDSVTVNVCSVLDSACCYTETIYNPCYVNAICNVDIVSTDWSTAGGCIFMVFVDTTKTGPLSIMLNGQQYPYTTDSLNGPGVFLFTNLPISSDSIFVEVCSIVDTTCCDSYWSWNPCPVQNTCNILSFSATADSAACIGDTMPINFDFSGNNAGMSGYNIIVVGQGTYNYNSGDPKVVYAFADCNNVVELRWQDAIDSTCMDTVQLGPLCCPGSMRCVIEDLSITAQITGGDLSLKVDVATMGTCTGQYQVAINGQPYGIYNYADGSITIDSVESNEQMLTVVVCDLEDGDMCSSMTIENPLLVSNTTISIDKVSLYQSGDRIVFDQLTQRSEVKGYTIDGQLIFASELDQDNNEVRLSSPYSGVVVVSIVQGRDFTTKKIILDYR